MITIKYIDIYMTPNSSNPTIRTKLPENQFDIRLVFSISCNPYLIFLLYISRFAQIAIYKSLTYINNRTFTRFFSTILNHILILDKRTYTPPIF